ncbi:MAG: sulfotransferase [Rhodothermales bacterium]
MSDSPHVRRIKKGEDLFLAGDHAAALDVFEAVLDEVPDHVGALNDAALAAAETGDVVKAVRYFERVLELDSSQENAFYNFIDLLVQEDAADLARDVVRTYRSDIPASSELTKYESALGVLPDGAARGTAVTDVSVKSNLEPSGDRRHVIIVAQPRSGTTILWKTLRQDRRLVCFDEPFRPHLRRYVLQESDDKKQTMGEYLARPDLIESHWSTLQPFEEFDPNLVGHQRTYLQTLAAQGEHVCMDFVRCSAHIAALRRAVPDALIVHLVRDPRAWVTSHLRPYGRWMPGLPQAFFTHEGSFDFWRRQQAAQVLGAKGYAHEQLLQVWDRLVALAETARPDLTIRFEHFALQPDDVLQVIYERMNLDYPSLDTSIVRKPNPPFAFDDARWEPALARCLSPANHTFLFDYESCTPAGSVAA